MTFLFSVLILNNDLLKQEADQFSLLEWRYIIRRSIEFLNLKLDDKWTVGDRGRPKNPGCFFTLNFV